MLLSEDASLEQWESATDNYMKYKGLLQKLYADDFAYTSYPDGYLAERGNEPRYFVDQSGAFYVEDGRLVQELTRSVLQWQWVQPADK